MKNNKQNILVIDGSYIGHRSVYTLSKRLNKDITLETQDEMMMFEDQYQNDIIALVRNFSAKIRIDVALIFIDNNSWRYKMPKFKPYYVPDDMDLTYKGNRKEKREKAPLDYINFKLSMREAGMKLNEKDGFVVSQIEGFEADDGIYLTAELMNDFNVIIFANDGDLVQSVIRPDVFYFNNSKSKDYPMRIVYVDKSLERPNDKLKLIGWKQNPTVNLMLQVAAIDAGGETDFIPRTFENNHIKIAQPYYYGFVKSIVGDKKDNILPILGWYSPTGRLGRVLPKHIDAVVEELKEIHQFDDGFDGFFDNKDELAQHFVEDILKADDATELTRLTQTFLIGLVQKTKQKGIAKQIFKHLKHNIEMMMLAYGSAKHLKELYLSKLKFQIYENANLEINLDNKIEAKVDIISSSIPDENEDKAKQTLDNILDNL